MPEPEGTQRQTERDSKDCMSTTREYQTMVRSQRPAESVEIETEEGPQQLTKRQYLHENGWTNVAQPLLCLNFTVAYP